MAKKKPRHDEAWARAKRLCRLNARQVEMAKRLGMNPKKLPSLVPSPAQRWKVPVGVFIEECYAKSFGKRDAPPRPERVEAGRPVQRKAVDPQSVIVHLEYLVDRLSDLTLRGWATAAHLRAVAADLRRVAAEIEAGLSVSQMPQAQLDVDELEDAEQAKLPHVEPDLDEHIPF